MSAPADGEAVDIEIYEALRRGDPGQAFQRLVRRHGESVHKVCYRLLGDRARAEDAMQETFMKAYQTIDTLQDPARLGPWLRGIAKHRCLDLMRHDRRMRARLDALAEEAPSEPSSAAALLQQETEREALRRCLDALPPEKRAAVLGRFYAALEYAELAAELGENADAIRIRVARVLPELRRCLERKGVKP